MINFMRIVLFLIFLVNSFLAFSQQKVELCPYKQTQFNYQSRTSQEGTYYWYLNGLLISNNKKINLNWDLIGEYTLTCEFENIIGCSNQETLVIEVVECPISTMYLPNCFTPNRDLLNEVFIPKGFNVTEVQFYIYNRWGQEIFKGDLENGWDGTLNGQICPEGNYLWYISFKDVLGKSQFRIGDVTLIR